MLPPNLQYSLFFIIFFLITGVTEWVPVFKGEQKLQLGLTCVLERGKTMGRQLLCGFWFSLVPWRYLVMEIYQLFPLPVPYTKGNTTFWWKAWLALVSNNKKHWHWFHFKSGHFFCPLLIRKKMKFSLFRTEKKEATNYCEMARKNRIWTLPQSGSSKQNYNMHIKNFKP